ncbi:MAG: RNA-directed DNA polymerase [Candidatus Saccharibacteria bacterium]|nr:RNA-directed DNA polymerase [Candidatus Saccharibacteria bacterium]
MQNTFEEFVRSSLWQAHREARKNKYKTVDEHKFELNAPENINNLCEEILTRHYKPSRGIAFIVSEPKHREIVAASYRDRVIHHFVCAICDVWIERHLINDSYSCRKEKGTLYGQRRLQHFMNKVKTETGEEAFVGKFDIRRYFVKLDRKKIFARAIWALDQQFHHTNRPDQENGILCRPEHREFLFSLLKFLWHQIIFDDPMDGIKFRGKRSDWNSLDPGKSLMDQPPGIGIVIGNLTSQELSNLYLDQLDRFVTLTLGYKYYGRYVDDFFIVVPASQRHKMISDVAKIEEFLHDELSLELHNHKRLYKYAKNGIPFTGGVVYPDHIGLSRRARRRAYEAAERVATGQEPIENFVARMGTTIHLNQRQFYKELFDKYGWDFGWEGEEPRSKKPKNLKNPANRKGLTES